MGALRRGFRRGLRSGGWLLFVPSLSMGRSFWPGILHVGGVWGILCGAFVYHGERPAPCRSRPGSFAAIVTL